MKKLFFSLILISLFSVSFAQKGSLRAYLSYASFYAPEHGPYIETYLSILGKSVQFVKTENGKFQGTVLVTMLFSQNDNIKQFSKYELNTAEIDDTTHINFVLFDQQRILLPTGSFDFELIIADKNLDLPPFKAKDKLTVNYNPSEIVISDIELIESYSKATETSEMAKSGYDFIPYQDTYYPQSINKIAFYAEVYNSSKVMGDEAPFVIATSIQDLETGIPIENLFKIKRETSNQVNVIFNEFDISALPSGNYNLTISVRDKENKEIASQNTFFQRSNPGVKFNTNTIQNVETENSFVSRLNNADTLREFIKMCGPISTASEKLFMMSNLKTGETKILQQFFLSFWLQRSPADPEGAWRKYYSTVLGVQQEFGSTNKKGYETDRGRVYLQYGSPNQRIIEPYTSSTLPYEIWQYYKYNKQTDLKFVFYTPDRSINDYILAHSTAIGEVKNVNWQYEIRGLASPLDTDNSLYKKPYEINSFGEQSGEFFNNPR